MPEGFFANEVEIAYHPQGFRIDKTATPLYRYTCWDITAAGDWENPTPVCFHSLPAQGWIKVDCFDWKEPDTSKECTHDEDSDCQW